MVVPSSIPPLLPKVDAILILDGDGNRLAGKYYGDFLTSSSTKSAENVENLRASFERQLQQKIHGIAARPDAAEVVTVMGKTAVFCGGISSVGGSGGDVRVVHVGPSNESELLLAHLCEGMFEALTHLMNGQTDRAMVLENLELVFLLIDEHCDGGIILEVDGNKLASSVFLRDDDGLAETQAEAGAPNGTAVSGMGMNGVGLANGEITIAAAFRQAKDQLIAGLSQRDGL